MERAVAEQNLEDVQRWTTKRKAALVLSVLKGENSIFDAALIPPTPQLLDDGLRLLSIHHWDRLLAFPADCLFILSPR